MRVQEAEDSQRLVVLQMLSSRAVSKVGRSHSGRIRENSQVKLIVYESSKVTEQRYLVIPGIFCSCQYFQIAVIIRGTDWTCKHLLLAKDSNDCIDDISETVSSIYALIRA